MASFGRVLVATAAFSACSLAAPEPLNIIGASSNSISAACQSISQKISSASAVLTNPIDPNFQSDIHHWYGTSTQTPACVVEVGSIADTQIAVRQSPVACSDPADDESKMQVIGRAKVPFAVRSGGHASNPGFSSTTGVHIAFPRMKQVVMSSDKSSVEIGMGMTWAEVYQKLEGTGYNVVGGRTQGPGVGGFTLGGGYSWKTNQYGLTCDNVKSFNLVLPNSTFAKVDASQKDLFFALKGGLNRFGVVTSAEYYTHPQVPQVYGGATLYGSDQIQGVLNATQAFFQYNQDPKAQVITTLFGGPTGTSSLVLFFYDGPSKPSSFKYFDGLRGALGPSTTTFSNFVAGFPSQFQSNPRGTFNTISTSKLTAGFLSAILNETNYWGSQSLLHSGSSISYDIEPFGTYSQYATDSAFPHGTDSPLPLNLYFAWSDASQDAFWYNAMKSSIAQLRRVALAEGILPSAFTAYPNYAISNTTAQDLYGSNLGRLQTIRRSIDPTNIMSMAGGFTL